MLEEVYRDPCELIERLKVPGGWIYKGYIPADKRIGSAWAVFVPMEYVSLKTDDDVPHFRMEPNV